jgi:hypothetical protein
MFSGCSSLNPVELISSTTTVDQPDARPSLPNPKPIETSSFRWKVITRDRLPEGEEWVYYAITPQEYEVLSRNMADILRWVRETKWRLDYYRGEGELDGRQGTEGDGGSD